MKYLLAIGLLFLACDVDDDFDTDCESTECAEWCSEMHYNSGRCGVDGECICEHPNAEEIWNTVNDWDHIVQHDVACLYIDEGVCYYNAKNSQYYLLTCYDREVSAQLPDDLTPWMSFGCPGCTETITIEDGREMHSVTCD